MQQFSYQNQELYCEDMSLAVLAEQYGTPLYVYSRAAICERYGAIREAFGEDAHICYAVKSNSNLSLLRAFHELGAGFDLVSGGELRRLQAAGVPTSGAVFAGVGKQEWEIREALAAGILFFNLESEQELEIFDQVVSDLGVTARLAVRLNPDVDAITHEFLTTATKQTKFGLDLTTAARVVERIHATEGLELVGYHVHLGSFLHEPGPYLRAFDRVEEFLDACPMPAAGPCYYDLGGGFGIAGPEQEPMDLAALAVELLPRVRARGFIPVLEPGRYLIADAGVLLTRVLARKPSVSKDFVVVDAAMNDLVRPALYGAEHPIQPLRADLAGTCHCDIVGPVCESGDFLARDRDLPMVDAGDLLAVCQAGAYGQSMASNYNSRRRPAEVLVDGSEARLIRRQESFEDLWSTEVDL